MEAEMFIKLSTGYKSRFVVFKAALKKDFENEKLLIKKQFLCLTPMAHTGTADLICDINPSDLEAAIRLTNDKNVTDLLKTYGPNEESILMTLCCHKNDSLAVRCQVFALITRVLEEANQEAIAMIIQKNKAGLSALDYATMANNGRIAAFLGKLFYIFGQDVLGKDAEANTILHMMARKGDFVAPTLK